MEHPRDDLAEKIKLMVAIGIPQDQICGILKMSKQTLSITYRDAIEFGAGTANTVVGGKIFEAAKRGESWACTLWAARRMGWKETSDVNLNGKIDVEGSRAAIADRIARATGEAGPIADDPAGSTQP
jgi:hypothetical protein